MSNIKHLYTQPLITKMCTPNDSMTVKLILRTLKKAYFHKDYR